MIPDRIIARIFGVPVDQVIDSSKLREALALSLDGLSSKEILSICLRSCGMTQQQTGNLLGCTRERVKQHEYNGLRKLRHPDRIARLQEHIKEC